MFCHGLETGRVETEMNGDKVISQHKSSTIRGYCDWYHDMTCLVFLCVQYGSF